MLLAGSAPEKHDLLRASQATQLATMEGLVLNVFEETDHDSWCTQIHFLVMDASAQR